MNYNENQLMDKVRKALSIDSASGTSIAPYIKQDIEVEAYAQLYADTDVHEMTLLKDLPRQPANQVNHEYGVVNRYGNHKTKASFAPNSLPSQANIEGGKKTVNLKVYGKTTAVQGLTVLQNTIRSLGQQNIADANDMAVKLLLQYQINTELFASDTRTTLDGNLFKGIFQLLDEHTRSSSSTDMYANGDIFIDMRGAPLLPEGIKSIRSSSTAMKKRHGSLRRLYMCPEAQEIVEENLTKDQRFMLNAGQGSKNMIVGNSVGGMQTNGSIVQFRSEQALSATIRSGTANDIAIDGAPAALAFGGTGAGAISAPAVDNAGVGRFDSAGQRLTGIVYVVTAVNEVGESLGSNVSTPVNAVAGKTIEFTINPRGNELSFRIYRGYVEDLGQADTFLAPVVLEPQFIMEIPNGTAKGNTQPITVVDSDKFLPGAVMALGTDSWSPNAEAIDRGEIPADSVNAYVEGRSAIAIAQLTGLFEFDLAKLGWLHSNKLFAHVLAPMTPMPYKNVVFYNCGIKRVTKPLLEIR